MQNQSAHALMGFLSGVARRLGVARHVYIVGGAPRNFVLDSSGLRYPIKDIDLVIDSVSLGLGRDSEWFAKELQKEIPVETKLVTNQYGVAILTVKGDWLLGGANLKGEDIEIANARSESYSEGGYKPTGLAPATIKEDVYRREFTFNSLLWRLLDLAKGPDKAEIIDLTGCGLKDLQEGVARCPRDPDIVFAEDPSRMIRAIRFLLKYGLRISPDVEASIRKNRQRLKNIPGGHLSNLLIGTFFEAGIGKAALQEMDKLGLLDVAREIAREDKAFRAALANWADKRADLQFMFDLMDLGMPVGRRLGFLTDAQKDRLRQITVEMGAGESDAFIEVLEQPGKTLDLPALIQEFGLKGADIRRLMDAAREEALGNPALVANPARWADRVRVRMTGGRQAAHGGIISRVAVRYLAKQFEINVDDPVFYGKYKNKPGVVKDFKTDERSGDPVVVIEPDPKGRKDNKEIKLLKIRERPKKASVEYESLVINGSDGEELGTFTVPSTSIPLIMSGVSAEYSPPQRVARRWIRRAARAHEAARYQEKKKVKTEDGDEAMVYVYSERQVANRNREKAKRVEKLRQNLGKLRTRVKKDLKSEDPKTRLTALVVGLINDTYERVGNDESAKDGHVGVTGWTPEHLKFSGGRATFTYVGKSGVKQHKETRDADLIRVLKEAVKDKKKGDTLFTYDEGRVDATTVNEYLKPFDITAKDIRGLHANREMQERLKSIRAKGGKLPEDKKEREKKLKDEFKQALEGTAEAVGHEPSTLKSQYLVPGLEDEYLKDGTVTEKMDKKGSMDRQAIISIYNAWPDENTYDGPADHVEGFAFDALASSLTAYEWALINDMDRKAGGAEHILVHPPEERLARAWEAYQHLISVKPGDGTFREVLPEMLRRYPKYTWRGYAVSEGVISELQGGGYLDEEKDGRIGLSYQFVGKRQLYKMSMRVASLYLERRASPQARTPMPRKASLGDAPRKWDFCPVCGEHYQMTCRCYVGHKTCPNGHSWIWCHVHDQAAALPDSVDTHKLPIPREKDFCRCVFADPVFAAKAAAWWDDQLKQEGWRVATKSPAEKEDEAIEDLIRPAPKKKPPRHDLRKNLVEPDKEKDEFGAEGDRDLSMNYKRVAARWISRVAAKKRQVKKNLLQSPAPKSKAPTEPEHKPGDVWQTDTGWAAKNPDGVSHAFDIKEKAQSFARGKVETPSAEMPVSVQEWVGSLDRTEFQRMQKELGSVYGPKGSLGGGPKSPVVPGVLDDIGVPPGVFQTIGEVQEFLKQKPPAKKKKPPKEKPSVTDTPPEEGGEEKPAGEGDEASPASVADRKEFSNSMTGIASDKFRKAVSALPPDQQARVQAAFGKAQEEARTGLFDSMGDGFNSAFVEEAAKAFEAVRGAKAKGKKKKDDEFGFDLGDIGSDLSEKTPEEMGRMLALAMVAQQELTDPLRVNGRSLSGTSKTTEEMHKVAIDAYEHFKDLTPGLRREAASRLKEAMDKAPEDSPQRAELERVLDGMALAASLSGETVTVDGVDLRPEPAPSFRALAKVLERKGRADILLGTIENFGTPESRKVIADALDDMKGSDVTEVLGGKDGPWKETLALVDWDRDGDEQQEEIKRMLRRMALNDITTMQAVLHAVSGGQPADFRLPGGGDARPPTKKVLQHFKKWWHRKKLPKKVTKILEGLKDSCQSGTAEEIRECKERTREAEIAHLESQRDALVDGGATLDPGDPQVAQMNDAIKNHDPERLDGTYRRLSDIPGAQGTRLEG